MYIREPQVSFPPGNTYTRIYMANAERGYVICLCFSVQKQLHAKNVRYTGKPFVYPTVSVTPRPEEMVFNSGGVRVRNAYTCA